MFLESSFFEYQELLIDWLAEADLNEPLIDVVNKDENPDRKIATFLDNMSGTRFFERMVSMSSIANIDREEKLEIKKAFSPLLIT